MPILRTTKCHQFQHPEFQFSYDPARIPVETDARWLVDWLEEAVAAGETFSAGQKFQIGWGLVEFRAEKDGALTLWEPDMKQFPDFWMEGVTNTLAHLRLQKDVCESVLSSRHLSFPMLGNSAIICNRLGQTQSILMDRQTPAGNDSGWFCGCTDEGHDHNSINELKRVSLYEVAVRYAPQIIPYLALPRGVLLKAGEGSLVIFRDSEQLAFKPGSYLAARMPPKQKG